MNQPFLLRPASVRAKPAGWLREKFVPKLGSCISSFSTDPLPLVRVGLTSSGALADEWRALLAAELLLSLASGRAVAGSWRELLDATPVFGSGSPTLRTLSECRCAAAVFPLDDRGARPQCAQIWLIDGLPTDSRDHRPLLASVAPVPSATRIYLFPSRPPAQAIQGRSWFLAAALARRALEPATDPEVRARLASRWIVTGDVCGQDEIRRVELGSKLALRTRRSWMVPGANRPDVVGYGAQVRDMRLPADLESAWSHISGASPADGGELPWPTGVEAMHSFVSGAWQPVLACALLCLPRTIVLWHTRNEAISRQPAEAIAQVLLRRFPDRGPAFVETRELSSASLVKASAELRRVLEPQLSGDRTAEIVFNITQGNRLMALAALTVAELYPNLRLVYRDLDAKLDCEFTQIRFEHAQPSTNRLLPKPSNPPAVGFHVNWATALFHPPGKRPPLTADEIWRISFDVPSEPGAATQPSRPEAPGVPLKAPAILVGNSFPFHLIRRPARIEPSTLDELRDAASAAASAGNGVHSFWGHPNTLQAASAAAGFPLDPDTGRPNLELGENGMPLFGGQEFRECWILAAQPRENGRSVRGSEWTTGEIAGWLVHRMKW